MASSRRSRQVVTATRVVAAERLPPAPSGIFAMRPSGVLVPAAARLAAGSYRAAENPRRRFSVVDGSGDFHLDDRTRMMLRSQSRDLERNNTFYDGLLSNWSVFCIGSGPRPMFRSASADFNKAAYELWQEDAANCMLDARRLFPWPAWCAMLLRCITRDGDAGVVHQPDASGLLLESERITNVRLDPLGRILTYTVSPEGYLGAMPLTGAGVELQAGEMSLPAHRNRPSQTRGLPMASATLDEWERIDSLMEAEIISAETASLPWMIVQSQVGSQASSRPPKALATESGSSGAAPLDGWVRTAAGSLLGLPPGLDGKPWTPNRPNMDVPAFARANLRYLAQPILPYEIGYCDIGDLNYAGVRALGIVAKRKIRDARTILLEPTISRIARDWARVQITRRRLPFVRDFARLAWDWDDLEIRDREKDATATAQEMENGTTGLEDELGPRWREKVDQLATERLAKLEAQARVITAAKQRAAALGIDWRDLLQASPTSAPAPASALSSR